MKRDKKRVEGEVWGEARLEDYLDFPTYDGTDPDFHCLYRAYTRMNEETFARFVELFRERGRNKNATNLDGRSLADILSQHTQAKPYLDALSNR
jgi:hypothetical protein